MKRCLAIFTAMLVVMGITTSAMAGYDVRLAITSPGITGEENVCEQYGAVTFTFSEGTIFKDGDQFYFDLPVGAQLCSSFDFVLKGNGTGGFVTERVAMLTTTSFGGTWKITNKNSDETRGIIVANNPIFFRVVGTATDRRVLFQVYDDENRDGIFDITEAVAGTLDNSTLQVDGNAELTLTMFNSNSDSLFKDTDHDGIYGETDNNGKLIDGVLKEENTLCGLITNKATALENGQLVNVSFDSGNGPSGDDFLTFQGQREIAHIAPVSQMRMELCKEEEPGIINIVDIAQGGCTFDYETSEGYCDQWDIDGLYKFYIASDTTFPVDFAYKVTLEILVDGKTGDNGVYWTLDNMTNAGETRNFHIKWEAFETQAALCDKNRIGALRTMGITSHNPELVWADALLNPADANDKNVISTFGTGICNETGKVTVITTANTKYVGANGKEKFLWIDFPSMSFNLSKIVSGQKVEVKVTLNKGAGCGSGINSGTKTVHVGTFGGCLEGTNLIYPYFTDIGTGGWWSGFAINNISEKDGSAKVYFYENDGSQGTVTIPVQAHKMYVGLTEQLFSTAGMVITPAGHRLGDDRGYMVVCTDFEADGFTMIGNNTTGEGQGYIPRVRGRNEMLKICEEQK